MSAIRAAATAAVATALFVGGRALAQNARSAVLIDGREAVAREVIVRFAATPADDERLQIERDADVDVSESLGPTMRRLRSRSRDVARPSIVRTCSLLSASTCSRAITSPLSALTASSAIA